MDQSSACQPSTAVIGAGLHGLSVAHHLLNSGQSVTLYNLETPTSILRSPFQTDPDLLIINKATHPNLSAFLSELGTQTEQIDMSLTFPGATLTTLNLFNNTKKLTLPNFLCWNQCFLQLLADPCNSPSNLSLGALLSRSKLNFTEFVTKIFYPTLSALTQTPLQALPNLNACKVAQFLKKYGFLHLGLPDWSVVSVRHILQSLQDRWPHLQVIHDIPLDELRLQQSTMSLSIPGEPTRTYTRFVFGCSSKDTATILENSGYDDLGFAQTLSSLKSLTQTHYTIIQNSCDFPVPQHTSTTGWSFHKDQTEVYVVHPKGFVILSSTTKLPLKGSPKLIERADIDLTTPSTPYSPKAIPNLYFNSDWDPLALDEDGFASGIETAVKILNVGDKSHGTCFNGCFHVAPRPYNWAFGFDVSAMLYALQSTLTIKTGQLIITTANHEALILGQSKQAISSDLIARVNLTNPIRASLLCLTQGEIGFAEAFMSGYWETNDLYKVLLVLGQGALEKPIETKLTKLGSLAADVTHKLSHNSIFNSKSNIERHYDLSNEFFKIWLDKTRAYSCGLFHDTQTKFKGPQADIELENAQLEKYKRIGEQLDLPRRSSNSPHLNVLEIGSGWGGLAMYLEKHYNVHIHTITLSEEQAAYVRDLHNPHIYCQVCDYRNIPKENLYDRIVSVEMIEAVGYSYVPGFFKTISHHLKSGGLCMIQAITQFDSKLMQNHNKADFIKSYIFPGGCLTALGELAKHGSDNLLVMDNAFNMGHSYAQTLRCWREKFFSNIDAIKAIKVNKPIHSDMQHFDDRFVRMWDFYLSYCEAGFRIGLIQAYQVLFQSIKKD